MKAIRNAVVLTTLLLLTLPATGRAQQPPPGPASPRGGQPPADQAQPPRPPLPIVPLKVDVVLVKYQGDKKVSSTPYSLSVNTNTGKASLRMGAEVPVPAMVGAPSKAPDGTPIPQSVQYRPVGTKIDCFAQTAPDSKYRVNVTIEDTSVYASSPDMPAAVAGAPTLRTFQSSNELLLKDGQTTEFMAATDKVSGEVIKAEVTLTVLK